MQMQGWRREWHVLLHPSAWGAHALTLKRATDHQVPLSSLLQELVHLQPTPSPLSLPSLLSFTEKKGHHWPQYKDVLYPSNFFMDCSEGNTWTRAQVSPMLAWATCPQKPGLGKNLNPKGLSCRKFFQTSQCTDSTESLRALLLLLVWDFF